MDASIYRKPVVFAVAAGLVVLAGTIATMAYPMLRDDMHPRIEGMKPLSPIELAGRDVYQREGCTSCHTQTVRPLRSEVVRYGGSKAQEKAARYSIAGEFANDHPFLWGSKRTGPDLAFEGWIKPSAAWQRDHLADPQKVVPGSNMPRYAFLADRLVDGEEIRAHMRALRRVGVAYHPADLEGAPRALQRTTELDALVAYVLSLGRAVDRSAGAVQVAQLERANPVAGDAAAIARGKALFADDCAMCHGDGADGKDADGAATPGPSLTDDVFLGVKGDVPDATYFAFIQGGSDAKAALGRPGLAEGGMPGFAGQLPDRDLWSIVAWLRSQKGRARP
jgi:cytochrome c oxidase cbb3-type subunit 2